jgi:hypothetical protein
MWPIRSSARARSISCLFPDLFQTSRRIGRSRLTPAGFTSLAASPGSSRSTNAGRACRIASKPYLTWMSGWMTSGRLWTPPVQNARPYLGSRRAVRSRHCLPRIIRNDVRRSCFGVPLPSSIHGSPRPRSSTRSTITSRKVGEPAPISTFGRRQRRMILPSENGGHEGSATVPARPQSLR